MVSATTLDVPRFMACGMRIDRMVGNFKLVGALERSRSDPPNKCVVTHGEPPGYPAAIRDLPITGHRGAERFFTMFGDVYLAGSSGISRRSLRRGIPSQKTSQRALGWEPSLRGIVPIADLLILAETAYHGGGQGQPHGGDGATSARRPIPVFARRRSSSYAGGAGG